MMHGLISIFDCETYIEVTQYEFVFDNPQYEFIVYISLNVTMDMTYIGVGSHGWVGRYWDLFVVHREAKWYKSIF